MNRRQFLSSVAGSVAASMLSESLCDAAVPTAKLGLADFALNTRRRAEQAGIVPERLGSGPLNYLKYCHSIGAGGVQVGLGNSDATVIKAIRAYLETNSMFLLGTTGLPRNASAVDKFDQQISRFKQAGAKVVRIAIGGRRYEDFESRAAYQAFADKSWASIQLAAPIAAKHRIPLAIENHKDWRIFQLVGMLEKLDSEYVGVCVDTGNSFALLEDPLDVAKAYAPWAKAVHLKDMAVCEYQDGILLADISLGEGLIDLKQVVSILRQKDPEIPFVLDTSVRDPLKVPCLTKKYWASFENFSASDLARALRYVRANARPEASLLHVRHLSLAEHVKLEDKINTQCLDYASQFLNL